MTLRISYEEREGIGKESFNEISNQYSENNSEQYRKVHKRIRNIITLRLLKSKEIKQL